VVAKPVIIPALERWRQEGLKFQFRLGYMARPCPKRKETKQKNKTTTKSGLPICAVGKSKHGAWWLRILNSALQQM
jgi:hypothetical protein